MTRIWLTLLFFYSFIHLSTAQVSDDFADGDFTVNPPWQGNTSNYQVNTSGQLQQNSTAAGTSYLVTPISKTLKNCEWRFWIRQNFSPSSNNYGRIYLAADQPDLNASVHGYFLQMGEAGSNDAIELFRQQGNQKVSVCRGINGKIASPFALHIKVLLDSSGLWKIYTTSSLSSNWTQEASGTDNAIQQCKWLGIFSNYTASNADKFYYDNFYFDDWTSDSLAPKLLMAKAISNKQLDLLFSEELEKQSAEVNSNYLLKDFQLHPVNALQDANNKALVHLNFDTVFTSGTVMTLVARTIKDLNGNELKSDTAHFLWLQAHPLSFGAVCFTEIMADPTPANYLPDAEYVELLNRSLHPINLSGWKLMDKTLKEAVIDTAFILAPGEHLLLTSKASVNLFTGVQLRIGLTNFPSLNDEEDLLYLKSKDGKHIDSVHYNKIMYHDSYKEKGGWALEKIDTSRIGVCYQELNWRASINTHGGTPAAINSVAGTVTDRELPEVSGLSLISKNKIILRYNKLMDSASVMNTIAYNIQPTIGVPIKIKALKAGYQVLELELADSIAAFTTYTLTVNGVMDCAGNNLEKQNSFRLGIPEIVDGKDIVINELLFDPLPGHKEWIELYNRSEKILNMKDVLLSLIDTVSGKPLAPLTITTTDFLVFPGDYLIIGEEAELTLKHYPTSNTRAFINMNDWKALDNNDHIGVCTKLYEVIDEVNYKENWHFPLLRETRGVSLERVDYNGKSKDSRNWNSAAESAGFATPSVQNSQYFKNEYNSAITISPEIFSPDNDGYADNLLISYTAKKPGMFMSITVYDANGIMLKAIARNEACEEEGAFSWNGLSATNSRLKPGIYILHIEFMDKEGKIEQHKKAITLATKVN